MNQYQLAEFFRDELHMKADINVTKYLVNIPNYQKVIVDIVLKNETEIAIEHKELPDIGQIEKGIGQALINLLIFPESWLSVPEKALELAIPILKKVNNRNFRIFDWDNIQLHELRNGEVVAYKL
jgi:hypothetical protein